MHDNDDEWPVLFHLCTYCSISSNSWYFITFFVEWYKIRWVYQCIATNNLFNRRRTVGNSWLCISCGSVGTFRSYWHAERCSMDAMRNNILIWRQECQTSWWMGASRWVSNDRGHIHQTKMIIIETKRRISISHEIIYIEIWLLEAIRARNSDYGVVGFIIDKCPVAQGKVVKMIVNEIVLVEKRVCYTETKAHLDQSDHFGIQFC